MSILGLGTDIVNIKRIEKILKKNKKNFIDKILHSKEKKGKKITAEYLSKKFSAKEAFSKALGTGIGKVIQFNEIIIINKSNGKPTIQIEKKAEKRVLKKLKVNKAKYFISISDDYPFALATVIISK
ncbi:MAG: holo-ACP synthase [Pelagibacteraceae bacterium]|nr:holo-ACP synthase [Pelagibacteraceae bacterium]MCI5079252.1 holo-ACP synthase [Pelagibacteraceae bacterium]